MLPKYTLFKKYIYSVWIYLCVCYIFSITRIFHYKEMGKWNKKKMIWSMLSSITWRVHCNGNTITTKEKKLKNFYSKSMQICVNIVFSFFPETKKIQTYPSMFPWAITCAIIIYFKGWVFFVSFLLWKLKKVFLK